MATHLAPSISNDGRSLFKQGKKPDQIIGASGDQGGGACDQVRPGPRLRDGVRGAEAGDPKPPERERCSGVNEAPRSISGTGVPCPSRPAWELAFLREPNAGLARRWRVHRRGPLRCARIDSPE